MKWWLVLGGSDGVVGGVPIPPNVWRMAFGYDQEPFPAWELPSTKLRVAQRGVVDWWAVVGLGDRPQVWGAAGLRPPVVVEVGADLTVTEVVLIRSGNVWIGSPDLQDSVARWAAGADAVIATPLSDTVTPDA